MVVGREVRADVKRTIMTAKITYWVKTKAYGYFGKIKRRKKIR